MNSQLQYHSVIHGALGAAFAMVWLASCGRSPAAQLGEPGTLVTLSGYTNIVAVSGRDSVLFLRSSSTIDGVPTLSNVVAIASGEPITSP